MDSLCGNMKFPDGLLFEQGAFNCIHVNQRSDPSVVDRTINTIRTTAENQDLTCDVCLPAKHRTGFREWLFPERPTAWVARNAGISKTRAAEIIDNFELHPIHMEKPIGAWALNIRTVLGMAVLIAKNPEVLIYTDEGMDPDMARQMHKCLANFVTKSVFVFVQFNSENQNERCPETSNCMNASNSA